MHSTVKHPLQTLHSFCLLIYFPHPFFLHYYKEDIAAKSHKQMGESSLESDENVRPKSNSGVISFKLPTTLNGHPVSYKKPLHSSTSSTSGEDTDTAPLHHICRPTACTSMSTDKTKKHSPDSQQS